MLSPRKIILLGVKHSGKTSIGKKLAEVFAWPFFDLDDCIETRTRTLAGTSLRDFYQTEDRSRFFTVEKQCLATFLAAHGAPWILATGGGIVDNSAAIESFPADALKIFLHNAPEVLFQRIEAKGLPPFLAGEDPYRTFLELYSTRTARYRQIADLVVALGAGSKEENAEIVVRSIKEFIHAGK